MKRLWNIRRATGIGVSGGLAALLLWPIYAYQEAAFWPFVAALAVAAVCGASILLMTGADMLLRRRGERVRPVRAFDIVLGLLLTVPASLQLDSMLPR